MTISEWRNKYGEEAYSDLLSVFSTDVTYGHSGSETEAQRAIRLATAQVNGILFRNNSGVAREEDRVVRYGLGNESERLNKKLKSADLIGVTPLTVTPMNIGQTWGIFTAVEVKKPGWKFRAGDKRAAAQKNFLDNITIRGGIATFATHPDDYIEAIRRFTCNTMNEKN